MAQNQPRIRIRSIALPTEHGGWGFLFEPILLGLISAPSRAGAWLSVAMVATFLLKHPLTLCLRNWERVRSFRRFRIAARVAGAYAAIAVMAFAIVALHGGLRPFLPLIALAPFAAVYGFYETRNDGRRLLAELSGPIALSASAPAIVSASGESTAFMLAVWFSMLARLIPSILYVRARLRLEKGQSVGTARVASLHAAFAIAAIGAVLEGYLPTAMLVAFALLWVRAAFGLSRYRRWGRARQIGFMEIGFGLLYVLITALGIAAVR